MARKHNYFVVGDPDTETTDDTTTTDDTDENSEEKNEKEIIEEEVANDTLTGRTYTTYTNSVTAVTNSEVNTYVSSIVTTDTNGIFGLPYQFMTTVDRRVEVDGGGSNPAGRMFIEKIMSRMPILFLTPGKQVFMDSAFTTSDKNNVIAALVDSSGDTSSELSSLIQGSGKYYTFEYDYTSYWNAVNYMCQVVARFMGIHNQKVTIGGTTAKLKNFTWQNATSDNFKTFFSSSENIVFYLDGLSSIGESFSNSTTESSLASTMNGFSETAREIQFLFGGTDSVINTLLDSSSSVISDLTSAVSSITSLFDGGGIISSLCNTGVTSVLSGGKIVFPELWSDFTYDRSYSLDIKLRSPDHDSLSIYLNIIVPYIHLLALCLPKAIDDDPNAYTSPFLVKAYCKGMFNIDMGLVTGLSVTKGAECCWNDDGLPTQIDISLEIKDLYSCLFMNAYSDSSLFEDVSIIVNNTSMMDFLANTAGVNLAQEEIGRRYTMWNYLVSSKFKTTPARLWTRFDNAISNIMYKLYNTL